MVDRLLIDKSCRSTTSGIYEIVSIFILKTNSINHSLLLRQSHDLNWKGGWGWEGECTVKKEELLPKQIHPYNFLQKWQNIFSIADWSARSFLQLDRSFRGSLIWLHLVKIAAGYGAKWHDTDTARRGQTDCFTYWMHLMGTGDKEKPFVRHQRGIVIINEPISGKLQRSPGMKMSFNAYTFTLFKVLTYTLDIEALLYFQIICIVCW